MFRERCMGMGMGRRGDIEIAGLGDNCVIGSGMQWMGKDKVISTGTVLGKFDR